MQKHYHRAHGQKLSLTKHLKESTVSEAAIQRYLSTISYMENVPLNISIVDLYNIEGVYHASWRKFMKTVVREITLLSEAISNYEEYDRKDGRIYHIQPYSPPRPLIFSAFRFDCTNIRVVILGQDPYPGINRETGLPDAMGTAFSCPRVNGISSSMNNVYMQIFKTWDKLRRYDKTLGEYTKPTHCDLTAWQEQGVFLFNLCAMLLYNSRNPVNPWIFFTTKLLRYLAKRKIVWLLLGRSAQSIIPQLKEYMGDLYNDELIITAPHPSSRNVNSDFTMGNCFLHINLTLLRMGQEPINWSIT